MKSTQTLAICDLNAAVAALGSSAPHNTRCLHAQFIERVTGMKVQSTGTMSAFLEGDKKHYYTPQIRNFVELFDRAAFGHTPQSFSIAEIRRQLPIEVEVEML